MKLNRRKFISTTTIGGLAATVPMVTFGSKKPSQITQVDAEERNAKLDEILMQPVLKTEFFPDPDYPWKSTTTRIGEDAGFLLDGISGSFWNYTARFIKSATPVL